MSRAPAGPPPTRCTPPAGARAHQHRAVPYPSPPPLPAQADAAVRAARQRVCRPCAAHRLPAGARAPQVRAMTLSYSFDLGLVLTYPSRVRAGPSQPARPVPWPQASQVLGPAAARAAWGTDAAARSRRGAARRARARREPGGRRHDARLNRVRHVDALAAERAAQPAHDLRHRLLRRDLRARSRAGGLDARACSGRALLRQRRCSPATQAAAWRAQKPGCLHACTGCGRTQAAAPVHRAQAAAS